METLQRTANRGSVATEDYEISNSIMFSSLGTYADANSLFYHLMNPGGDDNWAATSTSGTNARKLTVSCWFKRTALTESSHYPRLFDYRAGGVAFAVYFNTSDQLQMYDDNTSMSLISNQVFRDLSAWSHIVVQIDSTQATASDRVNVYINGEKITSWATEDYGNQNVDLSPFRTTSVSLYIGSAAFDYSTAFNGYIADYHFIDGSTVAHTEFGETDSDSGIWKPKQYTGSYGILGHYYNFSDASDMGEDFSGNNNDANNRGSGITNGAARQATDTPTNNFCTLNDLINFKYTTNGIGDGGTTFGDDTGGGVGGAFGTMAVTAGKWYWEVKLVDQQSHYIGISAVDDGDNVYTSTDPQEENSTFRFNISAARREYASSGSQTYGSLDEFSDFHTNNDIIGIALNMDDNQISIYGNGTLQSGVANSSIFDAADKMVVPFHGTINDEAQYNFGGYSAWTPSSAVNDANGYGTFEYSPPSGYYALCTKNLAEFGG